MCTSLTLKTEDVYFGRNLDLEYRFNENVVITPRNYKIKLKNKDVLNIDYAIIGMATVVDDYPLYAEATNEEGLAMAGLYFPKNAKYFEENKDKLNLTPYELILYFLGKYKNIEEIKNDLENLNILNVAFNDKLPLTDLHWMISDKKQSIVIEQMEEGLKIYDNPVGVLTNNPPFNYQLMNLNNYINLSAKNRENAFSKNIDLQNYGQGIGAIGLPGDTSPMSRFVRASFNKLNSKSLKDENSSVTQFFHILDSVSMVRGSTITENDKEDITTYSCCINLNKGIYYYKTYENNQITAIKMTEKEKTDNKLTQYKLREVQNIKFEN